MGVWARFRSEQGGATAVMFGLAAVPLLAAVGGAVDYGRVSEEHARLQVAIDAAAIALVREPKTASDIELTTKAQALVGATYRPPAGTAVDPPVVRRDGRTIRVTASGRTDTIFMKALGHSDMRFRTEAHAAWGQERLEVALVLDNTGSMDETIGTKKRIDELKRWATKFVEDLKKEAADVDDVRLSIVPFDTEVRIQPKTYRNETWLRFAPGSKRKNWTGHVVDRYQPHDMSDDKPDDGDKRYTTLEASDYADVKDTSGKRIDLAYVQPLVSLHDDGAFRDAKGTIAAMQPRGNTNVGLGLSWGLGTLTGSIPLASKPSSDARPARRYIVLLTDGDNTQNRVNGERETVWHPVTGRVDPAHVKKINDRTLGACATAKDPGKGNAEVFTIKLLKGDEAMLRACASTPNERTAQYYFDVQSESQLEKAFAEILRSIAKTRLTH